MTSFELMGGILISVGILFNRSGNQQLLRAVFWHRFGGSIGINGICAIKHNFITD